MSEQQAVETVETKEANKKKLEAKRKKEYEANRKALDEICELYPEVFSPSEPKPLQIGIHEAVAADGKLSKTRIRRALNLYVRMRRYVACIVEGAERITLGGEVTGTVTADEANHAKEKLVEIDKKRAARKPASNNKPKANKRPARKANPAKNKAKPASKPVAAKAKVDEDPKSAQDRMQAKLAALVNKRSN